MAAPAKLHFADVVALDLAGRRFAAREGVTHVRGVVRAVGVEGDMLRIDVASIERRQRDGAWERGADFDYQGHRDSTSIFLEPGGAMSIDIMYIGTINILEDARA